MPTERDVWLICTNWKGETERRHVRPHLLRFGDAPPWHTGRQWLLDAFDLERNGVARTFALSGIRAWAATAEGLPPPLDPALLARLLGRYGGDPDPPGNCRSCNAPLVVQELVDGQRVWRCPWGHIGGKRYREAGDEDVLALVRWARGLAGGEGDANGR